MTIRISVIIPTYNAVARLTQTIESVLAQACPAHEIIVVDDGSTDATPTIEARFAGRVRYIRTTNGGQQRARNIGVDAADGDWIALLDHDDRWEPGYLCEVAALAEQGRVDMTMCNSRTWQDDGDGGGFWKDDHRFTQFAPPGYWDRVGVSTAERWSVLDRYDYESYLDFHPSQTSMVAIRRDLFLSLGGFDERLRGSGAENFEFEIRALRVARVGLIWQPLVTMVRHDANASLDGSRMTMDVVDCLRFALAHHGLDAAERAVVARQLQKRLPKAIEGAYTLREFAAVRDYAGSFEGRLAFRARLKRLIAGLPPGMAGFVAARLDR